MNRGYLILIGISIVSLFSLIFGAGYQIQKTERTRIENARLEKENKIAYVHSLTQSGIGCEELKKFVQENF